MPQLTGIIKIYLNGSLQRSKEGATLKFGGFEKTKQVGHAVYGSTRKLMPSEVEFELAHTSDTDEKAIAEFDGTVRFESDNGSSFVITNCETMEPPELTGGDGGLKVKMSGDPAEKE